MDGWWSEIDRDVRSCLERFGPMSPRDIARQLRLSEGAVSSVTSMLAQPGKLRIARVELPPDDDSRQLSLSTAARPGQPARDDRRTLRGRRSWTTRMTASTDG